LIINKASTESAGSINPLQSPCPSEHLSSVGHWEPFAQLFTVICLFQLQGQSTTVLTVLLPQHHLCRCCYTTAMFHPHSAVSWKMNCCKLVT